MFVDVDEAAAAFDRRGIFRAGHLQGPMDRKGRAALMARDHDAFNRWEAGQALATEVLLEMARAAQSGARAQADPTYINAIGEVLARAEEDHAFAALMLMPPLESELALAMTPADPDAIHAARMALIRAVAAGTRRARLNALYASWKQRAHSRPDAASAGRRALRNALLRYLTARRR